MNIAITFTERKDKARLIGIVALVISQMLCFWGIAAPFVISLVYLLAIGLPYPKLLRSLLSRLVAGFLLAFSLIQLAAVVQFFVFPDSSFTTLSLLTSLLTLGLVATLYRRPSIGYDHVVDSRDLGSLCATLFFVAFFVVLCFWKNDPMYLTAFGSIQGSDGASHYIAMSEMAGAQHLNYQTVQYYPKGFHLVSAQLMDAFRIRQRDLSWVANARVYFLMYVAWGMILAYQAFYLAVHVLDSLFGERFKRKLPSILLGCTISMPLALFYLLPFAREGFINYYYIIATILCGLLFLYDYATDGDNWDWRMVAYLLIAFGASMSWGPLLVPALLLIPALYALPKEGGVKQFFKHFTNRRYVWVGVAFALQAIPLYLHVVYAKLTSQQGINAQGAITEFHYGLLIAGLLVTAYFAVGTTLPRTLRDFASNVLVPFYILIGAFASLQYFTVGEVRYYAIKTAYLLEIILIVISAAWLLYLAVRSGSATLQRWVAVPATMFMACLLLIGITANPFAALQPMFSTIKSHFSSTAPVNPDIANMTKLGLEGKLAGSNNIVLHYETPANKLYGNAYIQNWANLMQHVTDGTPESGRCSGVIFSILAYGVGKPEEQDVLIPNIKTCIQQALVRGRPYFIMTDTGSVSHLREVFGDKVTYVY